MTTKKKISVYAAALIGLSALLAGFAAGLVFLQNTEGGRFEISGAAEYEQAGAPAQPGDFGKINVNTATAAELQDLPGIGPALSSRIIAWREEHGPFSSPEELINVSGIGQKTLESLLPYIYAG